MLHLIQSNKMEVLAEQLCEQLRTPVDVERIFAQRPVWVQSPGMAQWLKLRIAERHKVAANLSFPLPSSYIWQLYQQCLPDLPDESAFTKDNMTWKLMALLPTLSSEPEFAPVRDYLADGDSVKAFQLALKIADVFDQYLVYRPDWIQAWEEEQDHLPDTDVTQHPWQPRLWRALVAKTQQLNESPWHRANLHQQLLEVLRHHPPSDLPDSLTVFGISALPKQQLEVLQALSEHTEVFVYWLNPSCHYWGDLVDEKRHARIRVSDALSEQQKADYLDVGNPLLASWGKLGQDFQDMLLDIEPEPLEAFVRVPPTNLLTHLQHEIDELTCRDQPDLAPETLWHSDEGKIPVRENDNSFRLMGCHSRQRELEVLHDELLRFLDSHPEADLGDIIVMMPDVTQYAPLIHGVFGRQNDPLSLPYSISDRPVAEESPLVSSFLSLLNLQDSRFGLSDVMDILDVPAVRRRFDLSEAEFEQCRRWLTEAGARWALDDADKTRWGVPGERQNTWLFALERLLAGYAVSSETLSLTPDLSPFADIEGQSAQALGKLLVFVQRLQELQAQCLSDASLAHKAALALNTLIQFYLPEESDLTYVHQLQQAIDTVSEHQAHYSKPLEQRVFVLALEQELEQKGVGQRFLAGAVNFCTLMPMRAVPFKMVCLLGMNDADYPRRVTPMGFDLMQSASARKGDRSRRLDDKYLFLEAILSAREALYISYIGRSQRDNSELLPSVLVSELLDYCEQVYQPDNPERSLRKLLCHQAPLQPFDRSCFQPPGPNSYQKHWLALAETQASPTPSESFVDEPLPELPRTETLELEDWITFLQNPCKGFFQQRWQVRFAQPEEQQEDDEPFTLDPLTQYQLRQTLVERDCADPAAQFYAQGVIPPGQTGALALEPVQIEAEGIRQRLAGLTGKTMAHPVDLDLQVGDSRITGRQSQIYNSQLVLWRAGKIRPEHELSLWLRLLLLSAGGQGVKRGIYLGSEDKLCVFDAPDAEQARARLAEFELCRRQSLSRPQPFMIRLAELWLAKQEPQRVLQAFSEDSHYAEERDPYIRRCFADLTTVWDDFIHYSDTLWAPAVAARQRLMMEALNESA